MSSKHRPLRQSGFTLVELMVGMTIGLLVAVIILQVLSVFEAQKRTTTGTADAQTNGSIALFNIGRELQQAGYPLMPSTHSPLECTTTTYGATGIISLSPVSISNGVAATGVSASDTITLRYGSSGMGGIPTTISTNPIANAVQVDNTFGCAVGDITLISNLTTCALSSVTAATAAGVTPAMITLQNTTAAIPGANLACMGTWHEITYQVNATTGNLERQDGAAAAYVANVAGIVNIQAQYGISATANSNQVIQWVDPSGGTWAAPTTANRNLIKAIRIAVVARNAKMEAGNVSSVCSSTTASSPTGLCAWAGNAVSPAPAIDLSADANWRRYRYRVFETIIPLRNMIWSKDTL
ncbi:MAG: PilW family protein [Gallionella sp.]|jgi:type IV pilus assembly protein PilW